MIDNEFKALHLRPVRADLIRRARAAAMLDGKTIAEWMSEAAEAKLAATPK